MKTERPLTVMSSVSETSAPLDTARSASNSASANGGV